MKIFVQIFDKYLINFMFKNVRNTIFLLKFLGNIQFLLKILGNIQFYFGFIIRRSGILRIIWLTQHSSTFPSAPHFSLSLSLSLQGLFR